MVTTFTVAAAAWISCNGAFAACSLASPDNWKGGSGSWNTGTNWFSGTPIAGENVCISGTPQDQAVVNVQAAAKSGSISIDANSNLNLNAGLTMSGTQPLSLINAGQIFIKSGGSLTIQENTTIAGQGNILLVGGSILGSESVALENQDNVTTGKSTT